MGKQEPPKPGPACRNFLHIDGASFADIRHLVDEGDFGSEKGIRGVFDQFRGAEAGEENRCLVEKQRSIDLAHHLPCPFILGPHDDSIRTLEVIDRCPLAQKFRIGDDRKLRCWRGLADDGLDLIIGRNGNR